MFDELAEEAEAVIWIIMAVFAVALAARIIGQFLGGW